MAVRPNAIVDFPGEPLIRQQRVGQLADVVQWHLNGQIVIRSALQVIHSKLDIARECFSRSTPIAIAPRTAVLMGSLEQAVTALQSAFSQSVQVAKNTQATLELHGNRGLPDCLLPVDIEDAETPIHDLDNTIAEVHGSLIPQIQALEDNAKVTKALSSLLRTVEAAQAQLHSARSKLESLSPRRASDLASPDLLRQHMRMAAGRIGQHADGLNALRDRCMNFIHKHVEEVLSLDPLQSDLEQDSAYVAQVLEFCTRELKFVEVLNNASLLPPVVVDHCLTICECFNSSLANFDRLLPLIELRVYELRMQVLNAQAHGHRAAGNHEVVNRFIRMADIAIPDFHALRGLLEDDFVSVKSAIANVSIPNDNQNTLLIRFFNQTVINIDLLNRNFGNNVNTLESNLNEATRLFGAEVDGAGHSMIDRG